MLNRRDIIADDLRGRRPLWATDEGLWAAICERRQRALAEEIAAIRLQEATMTQLEDTLNRLDPPRRPAKLAAGRLRENIKPTPKTRELDRRAQQQIDFGE